MTPTKPRIYDLARVFTLSEPDQKLRKQKQSDLTKQIISICKDLGYPDKTSSSAIDESLISKVVTSLKGHGMDLHLEAVTSELQGQTSEKKPKKSQAKGQIEEIEPPPLPLKKQIKIIRRIKPLPPQEKPPETLVSEEGQKADGTVTGQEKKETYPLPKFKEEHKVVKPPQRKPWSEGEKKPEDVVLPIQPFRVAKPTMVPSMMGRTKRPHHRQTGQKVKEKKATEVVISVAKPASVVLTSALSVTKLAEKLLLPETEVVKNLFTKGIVRTVNQTLELELAIDLAKTLGYEVITEEETEKVSLQPDISSEAEEDLVPRPPVVTIMGHVDHGKTSLLDAIRETKAKITEQEAGGITQHIGAYQVEISDYDGRKRIITFLDTPGHEAFTAMRARGAQLTDIAILVVAADDGIMPQTIEAINHAQAACVPIVIAINKIDKEGANPDKVIGQLTEHNLLIEDYGGKTVCSKISAKKRINLDDLLTKITLVADAELSAKLRANPKQFASGVVIEAQLSKERGAVAHLIVQNGTLKQGDFIVAGKIAGRVRAMFNDHGVEVKEALPSMPVEIIGLGDVSSAGDTFQVYKTYQEAKDVAEAKQLKEGETHKAFGLVDFASKIREGQIHELKVIIKADVHGSAEAVSKEVIKLSTKDVLVRPIHIGSGNISENDINLAASAGAIVLGFHVTVDPNAKNSAQEQGIDIRLYEIIYKITEDLEKAVLGLLEPEKEEIKLGLAEVRQIFAFGKGNKVAGSYILDGKIQRNQIAKVSRNSKLIFEGKIDNLKRFKDDAREVQAGFECGISFNSFNDIEIGDLIECWTIIEKERTSLN